MCKDPAEVVLDAFDRRRRRRSTCRKHSNSSANTFSHLFWSIGEKDQHCRSRTHNSDSLAVNLLKRGFGFDLAQANMSPTRGGNRPHERPAVCMEHREGPKVAI